MNLVDRNAYTQRRAAGKRGCPEPLRLWPSGFFDRDRELIRFDVLRRYRPLLVIALRCPPIPGFDPRRGYHDHLRALGLRR